MNNLILFVNSFLSYLFLLVVVVVLCAIAIAIGITMRKKKDAKLALQSEATKEQKDIAES